MLLRLLLLLVHVRPIERPTTTTTSMRKTYDHVIKLRSQAITTRRRRRSCEYGNKLYPGPRNCFGNTQKALARVGKSSRSQGRQRISLFALQEIELLLLITVIYDETLSAVHLLITIC